MISYSNLQSIELDSNGPTNSFVVSAALPFAPIFRCGTNGAVTTNNLTLSAQLPAFPIFTSGSNSTDVIDILTGSYMLNSDAGAGHGKLDIEVSGANLQFNTSQNFDALQLIRNATVEVATSAAAPAYQLALNSFTIAQPQGSPPQGTLDLNNNKMFVNYGTNLDPMPLIYAYLKSGYAGGAWSGAGIKSSAAAASGGTHGLGYIDMNDGVTDHAQAYQVFIAYARYGDANLNGTVDFPDLLSLSQNYGNSSGAAGWDQGDFTYDGDVNFADELLLAQNYGMGT